MTNDYIQDYDTTPTRSQLKAIFFEAAPWGGGDSVQNIRIIYQNDGIYGLTPYLNLNKQGNIATATSAVFSFLADKAKSEPQPEPNTDSDDAVKLLKYALLANARKNLLDAQTVEEGIDEHKDFLETTVIIAVGASCALPDAETQAALANGKVEPELPSNTITTPPIQLTNTHLGRSSGDQKDRESEVALRAEHCDALRLLVKNCLELGLSKEVDDAIAIATRLKRPAFVAIAELCKKEADPTNVAGATDNHAWTRLRDRLSGTAIEVETSLA